MHTIEFTNILVKAALPLHPYLAEHPRLFLRLAADGDFCGETPVVSGELATGLWMFNSRLSANSFKQSLTIAVVTGIKRPGVEVVSVTLKLAELLPRLKAQPNGHQDFNIFDSSAPIQLKLVMTCSIKLSSIPDKPSQAVGDGDHADNKRRVITQSDFDPEEADLSYRQSLESLYARAIHLPDRDDNKALELNILGYAYHALYQKMGGELDLEKAISMHEKAMQFTSGLHPQLAERAHGLATALMERFEQRGDLVDIERAISHYQTAVEFTEDLDGDKPDLLSSLGDALHSRFERLGSLSDIGDAISSLQQAAELTPDGHPDKPIRLSNLGNSLRSQFERLGSLPNIDVAISHQQNAVELVPDDHPDKPGLFNNLGSALQSRCERLGSLADMDNAILNFRSAIQLTTDEHPDKPSWFNNLGNALQFRFERLGSLVDIDEAISSLQQAVQLRTDGHPNRPSWFNNLGVALRSRFDRLGNLVDVDGAIFNYRKAVDLSPEGHADKPGWFNNLGSALQSRFESLGNITDMNDAISNRQKAVELTPNGHPDKQTRFNDLGMALQSRFQHLGSLVDMNDAISNLQWAVELTPHGHPNEPGQLNNLGGALQARFERLGSIADIDKSISSLQRAVELAPDGHPDKPSQLSNLGNAHRRRFERLDNLVDMDDAISNIRNAIEITADGHPGNPRWLNNLGNALRSRFQRLGNLVDVDDAILHHRKAVEITPNGHPDKATLLSNLGCALQSRFEHLGRLADVDEAITSLQQAAGLTPEGHLDKPSQLSNLGNVHLRRFERLGRFADMNDAISSQKKTVELTPDGHPDKPARFNNLGSALQSRFQHLGSLTDMVDAISNQQKAVELTQDGHPDKPNRLHNLGNALRHRFERLGSITDMNDAISNQQKAVELTPDGHPHKLGRLHNLGAMYITRFERLSIPSDLESGLFMLSTVANSTSGSAMVRFNAARFWAETTNKYSRSPLDAFGCAIDLLPRVAWHGLAVTDQHALLAHAGGIVRDAVAAAIRLEEYETAVVWAEQGRSIVWQNLLGLRSPIDDLRTAHPTLASQLQRIAQQLEGSKSPDSVQNEAQSGTVEDIASTYSKLAVEWESVVDEIRQMPNFQDFLRAKSFLQLAPSAHEGPVVILNANDSQCDALVLVSDNKKHVSVVNIPLERFSNKKSKELLQDLTGLLASAGVRERNERKSGRVGSQLSGEAKFKVILHVLWQDVVKPVIEGLAIQIQLDRPPRIWWCATGSLAFLPIHAAGLYDAQEIGEKVSDYVTSSYTPTLSAILQSFDPVVQKDFQVLMVAQPSTPNAPPIPKTEDEVGIVHRLTAGARRVNLMRENATVESVREGMMESNWVHLACHGQQNPNDPMKSGFLLHDRTLKLSEIVKMSLPKADFAFLSACQTATGDEKLAEESAHLAAGMFLSGCRGVIATMWSIRDEDGPKIAEDVYSRIFKDGKPNRKEAVYALHEAVRRLRESGAECTAWVPFIHIGR